MLSDSGCLRRVSLKRDSSTLVSVCRKMISHDEAVGAQLLHERRHLGEVARPAARIEADADVLERGSWRGTISSTNERSSGPGMLSMQ